MAWFLRNIYNMLWTKDLKLPIPIYNLLTGYIIYLIMRLTVCVTNISYRQSENVKMSTIYFKLNTLKTLPCIKTTHH